MRFRDGSIAGRNSVMRVVRRPVQFRLIELAMKHEWLIERCESLTAQDVRLREMDELNLSEDNKRKLLERSDQLKQWETTKWLPFIADLMPNDEVWRFHSPPETWANFCGCAGYVVLRDGQIIRSLTTMRN